MILPTIRASFASEDADRLVRALGNDDPELLEGARRRLDEDGIDALLDDPRVLNALLTEPEAAARNSVLFYVLVRHTMLELGIDDRPTADYVASMLLAFGRPGRAYRVSDKTGREYHYLVDMISDLRDADTRQAFLLRTHLGNFSLWLCGVFPDYVAARVRRRGAPSMSYYERVGVTGYRMAAESTEAERFGLDKLLSEVAEHFRGVRSALNLVSDRYLWRGSGDPVSKLLREVSAHVAIGGATP